jgi:hypothetical protein
MLFERKPGMPGTDVKVGVLEVRIGPCNSGGVPVGEGRCPLGVPLAWFRFKPLTFNDIDRGGLDLLLLSSLPWSGVLSPDAPQCLPNTLPSMGVNML